MTRRQRRLVLIGAGLGVLSFALLLALTALNDSIVFFHSPNENTLISCLDGCSNAANPPKYTPILAGEHLRQKSAKAKETLDQEPDGTRREEGRR